VATETRTYPDLVVARNAESQTRAIEPGLSRKVLAYNDKLFLAEHRMDKGWTGLMHSHPHEQVVYVAKGSIRVTCQNNVFDLCEGDTFLVRGGVEHGAAALEDSIVVDVFTPCREDYVG
jgi:quercetin dioxygenase-like cupin family protein